MSQPVQPAAIEMRQKRGRLRSWALGGTIVLAVALIVILVAGEIVFSTDLPRNLVVDALQKQMGLRMQVKSLSTGWLGHTTLHDVTLTLPLSDKAFLNVSTLEINHSPLPWMLLTGSVTVHSISIDHPQLQVRQDRRGSWNLEEVAELLTRAGGAKNITGITTDSSNQAIPQLPRLQVHDATVVIADNRHRSTTITGLSLSGTPDGPLVWQYQAAVADRLQITGKVAAGGAWNHQINLKAHDFASWISPWIKSWPRDGHVEARWAGNFDNNQLSGCLDFDDAVIGSNKVSGPVDITIQDNGGTLQPAGLSIVNSSWPQLGVLLDSGQIAMSAEHIESKHLSVAFAGGQAVIDGKFNLADGAANITAGWRDVMFPQSVKQSGDLAVTYMPTLGRPRFTITLGNRGSFNSLNWDSKINVDGTGNTLRSLSLTATAPKLRFDAANHKTLDLSGLVAQLSSTPDGLALTDFHLGTSNPITGSGGYTVATRTAWFFLDARDWPVPHPRSGNLNIDLNVWCDPSRVHLQQLYLNWGTFIACGNGDYVYNLPKPVSAHVHFTQSRQWAAAQELSPPIRGDLHGDLDLTGTIQPYDLTVTGTASGADVYVGRRPLGDLAFAIEGTIRHGQVSVLSRDIELFGGHWYIAGHWPVKNCLLRLDSVRVRHLSLPLALARSDVGGTLDGNWSVDVRQLNPNGIVVQGDAVVSNLAIGGGGAHSTTGSIFAADEIQIPHIQLEDGIVDIKPVTLRRKMSDIDGTATAEISTTLANPSQLSVNLDASSWPLTGGRSDTFCVLWTKGKLNVDLKAQAATGHLDVCADTSWQSHPVGRIDTAVDLNGRQIDATKIQLQALGGTVSGEAQFDIDHPYQTHAQFDWRDIDLAQLHDFSPDPLFVSGKLKGSLSMQPATVARALEPLAVTLHVFPQNLQIRGLGIGDLQVFAYAGPQRFVLDGDPAHPSQVGFAGGIVGFWGRVSKHPGDLYQSLVQLNLHNLNLDAIIPRGTKVARTPGLVNGQITIVGRPKDPDLAFGEGQLVLSQSDLAGAGPIAALYNLMHLGHDADKPQGYGTIDFRIQHRGVIITALHYFDRGAEVQAAGAIDGLLKFPHCPVNIVATGTLRPLKAIDLPGVTDIEKALNALQRNAVAVLVTGHLDKPITKKIYFSDITQDMRNVLVGLGAHEEAPD